MDTKENIGKHSFWYAIGVYLLYDNKNNVLNINFALGNNDKIETVE